MPPGKNRKTVIDEQKDLIQKLKQRLRLGGRLIQKKYSSISKQIDRN
jgi:phospholipid N-methyltransferase